MSLVRRKPLTDEQALEVLKNLKMTYSRGRGCGKTVFRDTVFEAFCHAYKALEEKVENKPPHNTRNKNDINYTKWVKKDNGIVYCSICGQEKRQDYIYYCGNCGSDMFPNQHQQGSA